MSAAPDLPHLGKLFVYHGPSGVISFRIERQDFTHDGHVILFGTCAEGIEVYETGHTKDRAGDPISAFVTESQYMRLTNAALP